jgi:hypothetical protein
MIELSRTEAEAAKKKKCLVAKSELKDFQERENAALSQRQNEIEELSVARSWYSTARRLMGKALQYFGGPLMDHE